MLPWFPAGFGHLGRELQGSGPGDGWVRRENRELDLGLVRVPGATVGCWWQGGIETYMDCPQEPSAGHNSLIFLIRGGTEVAKPMWTVSNLRSSHVIDKGRTLSTWMAPDMSFSAWAFHRVAGWCLCSLGGGLLCLSENGLNP